MNIEQEKPIQVQPINLNDYRELIELAVYYADTGETPGSITKKQIAALNHRLTMDPYCVKHNIPFEALTEEDYIAAYEETQLQIQQSLDAENDILDYSALSFDIEPHEDFEPVLEEEQNYEEPDIEDR